MKTIKTKPPVLPEKPQSNDSKKDTGTLPPILIRDLRSCKRLLGRLIVQLQKGEIAESYSKTLAYLLTVYCELACAADFEERLKKLEIKEGE